MEGAKNYYILIRMRSLYKKEGKHGIDSFWKNKGVHTTKVNRVTG
jgi:hypothetical protein